MKKILIPLTLIVAVSVLAAGCSSRMLYESEDSFQRKAVAETAAAANYSASDMYAEEAAYGSGAALTLGAVQGNISTGESEEDHTEKLIRDFQLSVETEDLDELSSSLRERISRYGGYIELFNTWSSSNAADSRSAYITARIPSDKADDFLAEGFGKSTITSYNESTQDVSLTYTDLEARLGALKTEQERLTELLAEADTMESLIALESRLTEVRYEIESITSSLRSYDNRISYSTVSINMNEVRVPEAEAKAGFIQRVTTGFRRSSTGLFAALESLTVWVLSNILTLLLAAGIIWLLLRIIRKIRRKEKVSTAHKFSWRKKSIRQDEGKDQNCAEETQAAETDDQKNRPSEKPEA